MHLDPVESMRMLRMMFKDNEGKANFDDFGRLSHQNMRDIPLHIDSTGLTPRSYKGATRGAGLNRGWLPLDEQFSERERAKSEEINIPGGLGKGSGEPLWHAGQRLAR